MKKLSVLFWVLAVLLSDVMCGVCAYTYCNLFWGMKYAGYSAGPDLAFIIAIPFLIAMAVCIGLAVFFGRKATK